MDVSARLAASCSGFFDARLNALRQFSRRFRLDLLVRSLRHLYHFGPWRAIPRYAIRLFRPAANEAGPAEATLLPTLDADRIVETVRRDSVAMAGTLPEGLTQKIRRITDRLPLDHFQLMHLVDDDIRWISEDPAILGVLRRYFGCEPALLESTLVVTGTGDASAAAGKTRGTRLGDQNYFHFDFGGWDSLNVFLYLTDVSETSSYHSVARGSHRGKLLKDFFRPRIPNDEARARFGDAIFNVTGPAGTVFFENTEAFHRRDPGSHERRVMLNLLYASHRSWFSHGRASRKHLERRARIYRETARAA